jgi:hypothetical protein
MGFEVATPNGLTGSRGGGTINASPGGASISLANAALAANTSCEFTLNVKGISLGLQTNTTGILTSNQTAPGAAATATIRVAGDPFKVLYFSNLNAGPSVINITNSGALGAGLQSGTSAAITGSICANVYTFSADEQLVSCCSCPVTPNGLVSISVNEDLIQNTLTPSLPTAVVVKLVTSAPVAGTCNNSAAFITSNALAPGLAAWGTTVHALNAAPAPQYRTAERSFVNATLSAGELSRLGLLCNFVLANGSGFGVCGPCRPGGLAGNKK